MRDEAGGDKTTPSSGKLVSLNGPELSAVSGFGHVGVSACTGQVCMYKDHS